MIKRFLLSIALTCSLCLGVATPALAEDIVAPQEPDISNMSATEANQAIEAYNTDVDNYNQTLQNNYEAEIIAVNAHNSLEEEKAAQNAIELAQYEENYNNYTEECAAVDAYNDRQSRLEQAYANAVNTQNERITMNQAQQGQGITENVTYDVSVIPNNYENNSNELKTILIEKSATPAEQTYQIINLHLYVNPSLLDYGASYSTSNGFILDEELVDNTILAKWEIATADYNDVVTVVNEGAILPTSSEGSALFYNYVSDDYLNGYWLGSHQLDYNTLDCLEGWINGVASTFSYRDGAHYNVYDNVFSLYVYSWMQYPYYELYTPQYKDYPTPPEKVELYVPEYFVYPDDPLYLSHLDYLIPEEPMGNESTEQPQVTLINFESDIPVTSIVERTEVEQKENINIQDEPNPLTANLSNVAEPTWALLNLILMLITVILLLAIFKNRKYYYYNNIVTVIIALASVITFILTENIYNKMIIIDQYTWIMLLLCCLGLLSKFLFKEKDKEETE